MLVDTGEKRSKNTEDGLLSNWRKVAGVPERGRNRTAARAQEISKSAHQPPRASSTASRVATSEDEDYIEGEFDQDEDEEDLNIARASKFRAGKERQTAKVKVRNQLVLSHAELSVVDISYRWGSKLSTFQSRRLSLEGNSVSRRSSLLTTTCLFLPIALAHT